LADEKHIAYLIKAAVERTATPAELLELTSLLKDDNGEVTAQIEMLLKEYQTTERPALTAESIEEMAGSILQADHSESAKVRVISLWKRIAVAASIALMLGTGAYFLFMNKPKQIAKTEIQQQFKNDVAPPTNKATLTLTDGKVIVLDSVGNGSLATQGAGNASKTNDELVYDAKATAVEYHTLTVPRGSRPMQLQLADGSEVWLNAASTITYPTAFTGTERKITMTGEAYFEVAHNAAKSFIVSKNALSVQVLGTHFNVNAYDDEAEIKVTLLEGSVKVASNNNSIIIKPGEQAALRQSQGDKIKVVPADLDEVMAWKNGIFNFNREDITGIMKQLSRWYDAEIIYQGDKPEDLFSGIINRNNNISQVLKMLEQTNRVHFRIEDRKIIVTK